MSATQPQLRTLLDALPTRTRLFDVARHFGVAVPQKGTKTEVANALAKSDQVRLRSLVEWMGRDELKVACRKPLTGSLMARSRSARTLGSDVGTGSASGE